MVLLGAWRSTELSNISSSCHSMMLRFGGYRLGCVGCASRGWSDLLRVIGRTHFWSVCLGNFRGHMCYLIVCCYHFGHTLCSVRADNHIGSVDFVFRNNLVSTVVHFSLFAIECVHHEACHGG
jgi:hypothetical protein